MKAYHRSQCLLSLLLLVVAFWPQYVRAQEESDYLLFGITNDGKVLQIDYHAATYEVVKTLPQDSTPDYDALVFYDGSFYTTEVNNNSTVRVFRFGLDPSDHEEIGIPTNPQYHHVFSFALHPTSGAIYSSGYAKSGGWYRVGTLNLSSGDIVGEIDDLVPGDGGPYPTPPILWGMAFLTPDGPTAPTLAAVNGSYGTFFYHLLLGTSGERVCSFSNPYESGGLPSTEWMSGIAEHPVTRRLYGVSGYRIENGYPTIISDSKLYKLTDPASTSFCSGTYTGGVKAPVTGDDTPVLVGDLEIEGITDITFVKKSELLTNECQYYSIGNAVVCL